VRGEILEIQDDYRYGFNGMERDDEVKGVGNSYTTLFRMYDPRLGRWFSVDPKADLMPWQSPYSGMDNSPITKTDPKGDCPTCIGGALVGALVEASVQFAIAYSTNVGDAEAALKSIDWVDVGVAAAEGALTQGASAGKSFAKSAVKYGGKYLVGEALSSSMDLTYEEGFEGVGGDKKVGKAAMDFFFSAAAGKLNDAVNDGLLKAGKDEMASGVFDTYNKSQKEAVKTVFSTIESGVFQQGSDQAMGAFSSMMQEMITGGGSGNTSGSDQGDQSTSNPLNVQYEPLGQDNTQVVR
jgi:RHS repeat-associated protein